MRGAEGLESLDPADPILDVLAVAYRRLAYVWNLLEQAETDEQADVLTIQLDRLDAEIEQLEAVLTWEGAW